MDKQKIKFIAIIIIAVFIIVIGFLIFNKVHNKNDTEIQVKDGTYRLFGGTKEKKGYIVINHNGTRIQLFELNNMLDEHTELIRNMLISVKKEEAKENGEEFTEENKEEIRKSIDFKAYIAEQDIEFICDYMAGHYLVSPLFEGEMIGRLCFDYLPREDTIIVSGYKYVLEQKNK